MRAEGVFNVESFVPADVAPAVDIATGAPVGVATMLKSYTGEISGRSATIFTSAFDHSTGVGTYVAMESFEGSLAGGAGTFCFAHTSTTSGTDRSQALLVIVPGTGTGALAGISGSGDLAIDADGTHRIWFDYTLA